MLRHQADRVRPAAEVARPHRASTDAADTEIGQHLRQRKVFLVGGHLAWDEAAVIGAVDQRLHRGPPKGAGLHRLIDERLHLTGFCLGRIDPLARLFDAHHVEPQRVEGYQRTDIDAQRALGQAVHPLRKAFPVPGQTFFHCAQGNSLDARQKTHRGLSIPWLARGKAEAALADRDRGHTVPTRHRCIRIPVQLQIVVVVQVYRPRRDDASGGVHFLCCCCLDTSADHGDLSVLNRHIAPIGGYPSRSIHNRAVPNDQVVLGHFASSSLNGYRIGDAAQNALAYNSVVLSSENVIDVPGSHYTSRRARIPPPSKFHSASPELRSIP